MTTTLTVRDEAASGESLRETVLEFLTERITVRELIRSRVFQEVKDFNAQSSDVFQGLVQPSETERTLNGFRVGRDRQIDWEQQYELALRAFDGNGVLVLVDDRQAESLDDEIVIAPKTTVTFLKLIPLIGG
jgi:hypothetical protein